MADLFAKYNCTNCEDDITGIRVHCAECTSIDLCLQCFSAGAEIGEHRKNHAYQLMDMGASLPIFRGKGAWSAREEIQLLDSIEFYGFGNWEDISKFIATRSPENAKEEYVSRFLQGAIGKHTWLPAQTLRPKLEDCTVEEDSGPLSGNIQKFPPLDVTAEEAEELGYVPNRDGFEKEYDPTAEKLVSSLTLNQDDDKFDLLLKLAQVDMYTRRLRERAQRKRLVRDYQLVAKFFRGDQNKNQSRDQREFRDRFRVFAQFYTAHEYERLLASIERERELRIRLSELNRYRWNGLTRLDDCAHFEQHAAAAHHKNTGPHGHGRTDNPTTGNRLGSYLHSPLSKKVETANVNEKSSNSTEQKHMLPTGDPIYSDASSLNKNYSDSYQVLSGQSSHQTVRPTTPTLQVNYHTSLQVSGCTDVGSAKSVQSETILSLPDQTQVSASLSNYPQGQQHQQQLLPAVNLLSVNEKQLCTLLNLPPTRYITLKMVILSGAPFPLNSSVAEETVRKYLGRAGWLNR